jgi:hypothetical protein
MSLQSVSMLTRREPGDVARFFDGLTREQRQTVSELVTLAFVRGRCEATRRERQRSRQREAIHETAAQS